MGPKAIPIILVNLETIVERVALGSTCCVSYSLRSALKTCCSTHTEIILLVVCDMLMSSVLEMLQLM